MPDSAADLERPFSALQFVVTLDRKGQGGAEIGTFWECNGLGVSIEPYQVQEGGQNHFTYQLPGKMSWDPIVLKRGVTNTDQLLPWLMEMSGEGLDSKGNKVKVETLAIELVDSLGKKVRRWEFEGAWPSKWSGPSFSLGSNDMAQEELTIIHHGFKVK